MVSEGPSNLSGAALRHFLSLDLFIKENKKFWLVSSLICLFSGFLALSNAGILALGIALAINEIFSKKKKLFFSNFRLYIISIFGISLAVFSLYGRYYITENKLDNKYLRAIAGVRSLNDKDYDPSSGRIERYSFTIDYIKKNPIGIGVQVTGSQNDGIRAPAGALFYWLYLVGIPGLIFLLLRDFNLFRKILNLIKSNHINKLPSLAFIVIFIQQSLYGSWIDPYILIFSSIILSFKNK